MKRNTLLLVILVALVGTALLVQRRNTKTFAGGSPAKTRELLLPGLPLDGTIRKIQIVEAGKTVTLSATKDKWTVAERDDYPAAADKIRRLLSTLSELKITRSRPVAKESLSALKLLVPDEGPVMGTGLMVNLMNEKGDSVATFIVGSSIESTGGASSGNFMGGPGESRYVRVPNDEGTAWQVADSFSSELKPDAQEWVDKSFVDVRKIKDVRITAAKPDESWGAQRKDENSEFTLLEPKGDESLDTAKASGLANLLANPTFMDVLPKEMATPDFMKDAVMAKISTFEDFNYELKLLEKKDDKAEAEGKNYLSFTVNANIPKERKPEKDEKPEEKQKKDAEFATLKKGLEAKLAKEKTFEGRVFEIAGFTVTMLTKKRGEVLRDKLAPPPRQQSGSPLPPGLVLPPAAPAAAPEAPKPAEPKPAEPKPAEPKPVEPKPEEKKAEEPKADATKSEEPKAEEKKP